MLEPLPCWLHLGLQGRAAGLPRVSSALEPELALMLVCSVPFSMSLSLSGPLVGSWGPQDYFWLYSWLKLSSSGWPLSPLPAHEPSRWLLKAGLSYLAVSSMFPALHGLALGLRCAYPCSHCRSEGGMKEPQAGCPHLWTALGPFTYVQSQATSHLHSPLGTWSFTHSPEEPKELGVLCQAQVKPTQGWVDASRPQPDPRTWISAISRVITLRGKGLWLCAQEHHGGCREMLLAMVPD